jgi:hypothetical protein
MTGAKLLPTGSGQVGEPLFLPTLGSIVQPHQARGQTRFRALLAVINISPLLCVTPLLEWCRYDFRVTTVRELTSFLMVPSII